MAQGGEEALEEAMRAEQQRHLPAAPAQLHQPARAARPQLSPPPLPPLQTSERSSLRQMQMDHSGVPDVTNGQRVRGCETLQQELGLQPLRRAGRARRDAGGAGTSSRSDRSPPELCSSKKLLPVPCRAPQQRATRRARGKACCSAFAAASLRRGSGAEAGRFRTFSVPLRRSPLLPIT